jgi:hypothetical protein
VRPPTKPGVKWWIGLLLGAAWLSKDKRRIWVKVEEIK